MNDLQQRATSGESLPVDSAAIEQTLSELWRVEKDDEHAVTRAALWNVVVHATTQEDHNAASEVLGRVAASVPQRTIVIRADPASPPSMAAWISANCHLMGEGKQICSEEISIVATGDRVERVSPLINALLIPDMPVAVWFVGDLPHEKSDYVASILEPADRLIVDSIHFDNPADLEIVARVGRRTATAPSDLNWIRGEEWRAAAASIYDSAAMRARIPEVRGIRLIANAKDDSYFGQRLEPLFFAAWFLARTGLRPTDVEIQLDMRVADRCSLSRVEIEMDNLTATIERDERRSVLVTEVDGRVDAPGSVTRAETRKLDQLLARELKRAAADPLFVAALPLAVELANELRR